MLITCDFDGQIFIVDKVKVIEFKYVVVVLATEKPAEKSAGFCFGGPIVGKPERLATHHL